MRSTIQNLTIEDIVKATPILYNHCSNDKWQDSPLESYSTATGSTWNISESLRSVSPSNALSAYTIRWTISTYPAVSPN